MFPFPCRCIDDPVNARVRRGETPYGVISSIGTRPSVTLTDAIQPASLRPRVPSGREQCETHGPTSILLKPQDAVTRLHPSLLSLSPSTREATLIITHHKGYSHIFTISLDEGDHDIFTISHDEGDHPLHQYTFSSSAGGIGDEGTRRRYQWLVHATVCNQK